MAIRFRISIIVAFGLLVFYFVFWGGNQPFENGSSHPIDVLKGNTDTGTYGHEQEFADPKPPEKADAPALTTLSKASTSTSSTLVKSTSKVLPVEAGSTTSSKGATAEETSTSSAVIESTKPAVPGATTQPAEGRLTLQEQFDKDYDALGQKESAGAIYGQTLKHLVDAGSHAGFHAAALKPTESWTTYSDAPPYTYSPYPEYNSTAWVATNMGEYVQCDGPNGATMDVRVFSGHPKIFEEPLMGSYVPLDIDSNLCFERETRLGAYGYVDEGSSTPMGTNKVKKRMDWDNVNWRELQERCDDKNANRYGPLDKKTESHPQQGSNASAYLQGSGEVRRATTSDGQAEPLEEGMHGMPDVKIREKSRTAVLLRSYSGRNYTENDLQNIRSLISELSLGSGGEYTIFLLVKVTDGEKPIWDAAREEAVKANVPQEFRDMAILWNDAMMETFYPKSEYDYKFHPSEWLPVQKFAYHFPQYDFYWNWELDSRYTGHHYDLFEKLVAFAKAQPRKGLWERNERFYIPSVHGPYDSKFRATVERESGLEAVWGAPKVEGVKPEGPVRPVMDPRDDDYKWGVGEEADYISLAPIFNPVDTTWPGKNDVWGYVRPEDIPRRATVGLNSRCSKKLLKTMDAEIQHGNYLGSEMAPQTVALLHGLKAVFAPIPMFFDRAWNESSLDKYLNPGPKGVSGSVAESPFSEGRENRFEGTTWYEMAVVPRRLYYNWMGWEYRGIGGPQWEQGHGRTCLPPMLLHPIKVTAKPPPDHSSK